jgi:glycosyltransferase involved in cell wall biosynthesis
MVEEKRLAFIFTVAVSANSLTRGQLEFLRSSGVAIDIFVGGPQPEKQRLVDRQVGNVSSIAFRRQPHPLWDMLSLLQLGAKLVKRRYSAVIYSTPKAMLIGSVAAFLTRQPRRIAIVRGRAYENSKGFRRGLFLALDRITFACSHRVLFISNSLLQAYHDDGLDAGAKATVLGAGSSNGVDVDRFRLPSKEERSAARTALGVDDDAFLILVLGRITRDKGIIDAINLAQILKAEASLRFLFVGDIEDQELGRQLTTANDKRILQRPADSAPERYFHAADLHLFLSHREGFGNVAIEAAASGVPTFAYDIVGVRDSVVPAVTGALFPFGDIDKVAAEITAAERDRTAFRARFSRARDHVVQDYEQRRVWERYAAEFLAETP